MLQEDNGVLFTYMPNNLKKIKAELEDAENKLKGLIDRGSSGTVHYGSENLYKLLGLNFKALKAILASEEVLTKLTGVLVFLTIILATLTALLTYATFIR